MLTGLTVVAGGPVPSVLWGLGASSLCTTHSPSIQTVSPPIVPARMALMAVPYGSRNVEPDHT